MKLACLFAAAANASMFDEPDRKFSDKPEWIADEIWDTWTKKPAAYRVAQLACRINMFVDGVYGDAPASLQNSIKKNWGGLIGNIESAFERCTGETVPTEVSCGWRDWLDEEGRTVDNKVHTFVSWAGVAVRETLYKNGCEARAMKLVSTLNLIISFCSLGKKLTFLFSSSDLTDTTLTSSGTTARRLTTRSTSAHGELKTT